jgi:excisionase family DNA binding protein
MLGVALRTAQLWADQGILTAWRTQGGHRRISRSSVESVLAERHQKVVPLDYSRQAQVYDQLPLRVLLAESTEQQRLFRQSIRGWGLPILLLTAGNGTDTLLQIGRESPDLLIANLDVIGISGLDLVRNLARSTHREGMDIVLITALPTNEIARQGELPPEILLIHGMASIADLKAICTRTIKHRIIRL